MNNHDLQTGKRQQTASFKKARFRLTLGLGKAPPRPVPASRGRKCTCPFRDLPQFVSRIGILRGRPSQNVPFSAKKRHFNSGLCMSCIDLGRGRNHTNRASERSSRRPSLARRVNMRRPQLQHERLFRRPLHTEARVPLSNKANQLGFCDLVLIQLQKTALLDRLSRDVQGHGIALRFCHRQRGERKTDFTDIRFSSLEVCNVAPRTLHARALAQNASKTCHFVPLFWDKFLGAVTNVSSPTAC